MKVPEHKRFNNLRVRRFQKDIKRQQNNLAINEIKIANTLNKIVATNIIT